MSEQSPAQQAELARRVASHYTRLRRVYDAYKIQQQAAIKLQNDACALIANANAGMILCERRAKEQGYPPLFTL